MNNQKTKEKIERLNQLNKTLLKVLKVVNETLPNEYHNLDFSDIREENRRVKEEIKNLNDKETYEYLIKFSQRVTNLFYNSYYLIRYTLKYIFKFYDEISEQERKHPFFEDPEELKIAKETDKSIMEVVYELFKYITKAGKCNLVFVTLEETKAKECIDNDILKTLNHLLLVNQLAN